MSPVYWFLGNTVASAPLAFHGLSGNNMAGKFSGSRKEFWTGWFLLERNNEDVISERLITTWYVQLWGDGGWKWSFHLSLVVPDEHPKENLPSTPWTYLHPTSCVVVVEPEHDKYDRSFSIWMGNESDILLLICSVEDIAPEGQSSKEWCTDACRCGEVCQNTDAVSPYGALNTRTFRWYQWLHRRGAWRIVKLY